MGHPGERQKVVLAKAFVADIANQHHLIVLLREMLLEVLLRICMKT